MIVGGNSMGWSKYFTFEVEFRFRDLFLTRMTGETIKSGSSVKCSNSWQGVLLTSDSACPTLFTGLSMCKGGH
jgi:hypothetical protein